MGKKACLALDLGYDPWEDECHEGDYYDHHDNDDEDCSADHRLDDGEVDEGRCTRTANGSRAAGDEEEEEGAASARNPTGSVATDGASTARRAGGNLIGRAVHAAKGRNLRDGHHRGGRIPDQDQPIPFTVARPQRPPSGTAAETEAVADNNDSTKSPSSRMLHYVPNPHRRPLFEENVASQDGLFVQVASFLSLADVLRLSRASRALHDSLAEDGLYCTSAAAGSELVSGTSENGAGILLPCLRAVSDRLLPLDASEGRRRPRGLSRMFAYECMAFYESCRRLDPNIQSESRSMFEPDAPLSVNSPENVDALSFRLVRYEKSYLAADDGKGSGTMSPPAQKSSTRSGIRLSYVKSDAGDCALITMWSEEDCIRQLQHPMGTSGSASRQQYYGKERYLPPNTKTIVGAAIDSESGLCCILATPLEHRSTEKYVLSMVSLPTSPPGASVRSKSKLDPSSSISQHEHTLKWQRQLSSRDWQLFSSSETRPIVSFGSRGKHILFGSAERWGVIDAETGKRLWSPQTRSSPYPALATADQASTSKSCIDAYLLHHEFLFVLDQDGTRMRVYDVSNTTTREPLAEGDLPWSSALELAKKRSQGLVVHCLHRRHRRDEFNLAFCAGRVWVTGTHTCDLLCSSPPRLLRRLRSRLSQGDAMPLRFVRVKTDLIIGVPHQMRAWNDTHLYVVDSNHLHRWRKSDDGNGSGRIMKLLSAGINFIEDVHVDGTKVIVATNRNFRNTTTRDWDGSGGLWVIPIDAFEQTDGVSPSPPPDPSTQGGDRESQVELIRNRPCSPTLQLYHKRMFNVPNFVGNSANGSEGRRSRYPIGSSTNSNYQVVGIVSDGRYLLVRCKKGGASKVAILDLYSPAKKNR